MCKYIRLTRFGFHYLETFCLAKGIDVVAEESKTLSTEEELMTDMMSLIASFSGKLYGMRSHKKKCEDLKNVKLPDELTLEDIME